MFNICSRNAGIGKRWHTIPENREAMAKANTKVEIKVSVPDGARVTATSNGTPIKISHSMPAW